MSVYSPDVVERFWQSVERRGDTECWLWTKGLNAGKPRFRVDGRSVSVRALAYEAVFGGVPENRRVVRTCGERRCVNPYHTELKWTRIPIAEDGSRECARCRVIKAEAEFPRCNQTLNGRHSYCRECNAAENRLQREKGAVWVRRARHRNALRQTDVDIDYVDAALIQQHGRCAICGNEPTGRRLGLDHDHRTRQPRGMLCGNCNRAIGYFNDDPVLILAAIAYVERHREAQAHA